MDRVDWAMRRAYAAAPGTMTWRYRGHWRKMMNAGASGENAPPSPASPDGPCRLTQLETRNENRGVGWVLS
jgi:hypothetical protein